MYFYAKRFIDINLSIIGLIVLLPLFLIVGIAIKLESPGPIFFKQERVGYNRKSFNIYKFRTMRTNSPKDTPTWMLKDANQYITKIGKTLRKRSIDELPQLINVIRGEMSLIGPRPVVWSETELINAREKNGAFSVLPGLTGWAQINGRDEVTALEKARLDGEYAKKYNFSYDGKIFLGTIAYVLRMDGIVEGVMSTVDNLEHDKPYV